jgi:dTDP-4-amino-4,6-dideoxygalactose transaminase
VDGLEKDIEAYLGQVSADSTPAPGVHAVALASGTAAIHLALVMIGVGAGDEVICQSFTFAASANPILYQGAKPIFVDSEPQTWNMSPEFLEQAIRERKAATGAYPKAIIVVHLYGMPARMDEIMAVADRYGIPVVEDAAEALGSAFRGRRCGTFGRFGVLSFNGNKIITTSGGGALICRTAEEAGRAKFYATQARENRPYYYHEHVGYNYRMSNICAGIGRGQMEVLPERVARRQEIHRIYARELAGVSGLTVMEAPGADYDSNFWLTCITLGEGISPEELRQALENENIEVRPLWRPMHIQPVFEGCPFYGDGTSERLFDAGLCLPSGSILSDEQIVFVADSIKNFIGSKTK